MLEVECDKCKQRFWVKGHTTADSYTDPGEVVTELESNDPLCSHLDDGDSFTVVDEYHATFDDDVI